MDSPLYKAVKDSFPAITFRKGENYHRDGAVSISSISSDGKKITGQVQGLEPEPYDVTVDLEESIWGKIVITSSCSCYVGEDCKHAVAMLLEADKFGVNVITSENDDAIAPEVNEWLSRVVQAVSSDGKTSVSETGRLLVYILSLSNNSAGKIVQIKAVSTQLLEDGSLSVSDQRLYLPDYIYDIGSDDFIATSDSAILRRMVAGAKPVNGLKKLEGEDGCEILDLAIRTGHCFWKDLTGPVLTLGEKRNGGVKWMIMGDGSQQPELEAGDYCVTLPLSPPWYLDEKTGVCGIVESGLPAKMAGLFLSGPPIPADSIDVVRTKLADSINDAEHFLPTAIGSPTFIDVQPVPRLRLHHKILRPALALRSGRSHPVARDQNGVDVPLARLSFLYDGREIPWNQFHKKCVFVRGEKLFEINRSRYEEQIAVSKLADLKMISLTEIGIWQVPEDCKADFVIDDVSYGDVWAEFMAMAIPALINMGWQVDIDDDFPVKIVHHDGDVEALLEQGSGIDWFELNLGVSIDGERVNILPALLQLLRGLPLEEAHQLLESEGGKQGPMRISLEDGRILLMPFARIRPILLALTSLFVSNDGTDDDVLRFGKANAADLADLADIIPDMVWRGGERLQELGRHLKDRSTIRSIQLPDIFVGTLRPYQQAGVEWMQLLHEVGLGGILADDMGLGKTIQTLADITIEKCSGRMKYPCLVVAPTSLMANWRSEAKVFAPSLSVLVLQGNLRRQHFSSIGKYDIVLTTYPLLVRDSSVLREQKWHMVVLDEAQFVKNPVTSAAKVLRSLKTEHRMALSGTPLENHLGELWSLFDFILPGYLGDRTSFGRKWRGPIERGGSQECRQILARRIRPFVLRRTKEQVAEDLPPKTEIIDYVEMSSAQRDIYEAIRLTMHKKVRDAVSSKGLKRSRIEFLDALLKLRQVCCDPRLVKNVHGNIKAGSAKLSYLMEMLNELLDEGRRVLLFSQFTSMLALIENELQNSDIPYLILTGNTKDRATPVNSFQNGEVPLFLISLKAGGTGLNLTAADTVIHYDPWWNPAVEAQATDRAHRIGQDKPVFVHKLMAVDTIEIKMSELKSRKQALADGILDPEASGLFELGEDDIEFLLG